jgi:hypothetical protein
MIDLSTDYLCKPLIPAQAQEPALVPSFLA